MLNYLFIMKMFRCVNIIYIWYTFAKIAVPSFLLKRTLYYLGILVISSQLDHKTKVMEIKHVNPKTN